MASFSYFGLGVPSGFAFTRQSKTVAEGPLKVESGVTTTATECNGVAMFAAGYFLPTELFVTENVQRARMRSEIR